MHDSGIEKDATKIDMTIGVKQANKVIFSGMLLLITFIYFMYDNINKANLFFDLQDGIASYGNKTLFLLLYLLCLLFLIVFHAFLHAFFLIIIGGLKKDNIKIAIENKKLMPYVLYDVPVRITAYRWSLFLPYFLLGLVPLGYGVLERKALWVFAGMLVVVSFMVDMLVLIKLARVSKVYLAITHPQKFGCILYKDKKETDMDV